MSAADAAKTPVSAAEAADLFAPLNDARGLVLAVSGGPDSTALLALAARWRRARDRGPALLAVTIDHGLRPESRGEAEMVKRLAKQCGVAHRTMRWTGRKPASGLQRAAREMRYRLLAEAAARIGASHILTAHTCDDQAETVLLRMSRGSGITGLGAMTQVSPLPVPGAEEIVLMRPFLDLPKSRLIATLAELGLSFADDPSNRNPRFTRARLRALMPVLDREGLNAARLSQLASRLRRAEAALEAATDAVWAQFAQRQPDKAAGIVLDRAFMTLPDEVRLRLLGRAIAQVGDEGPVELGKLETLHDALAVSSEARPRLRRTLAGAVVTLHRGEVTIERAPARRHAKNAGHRSLNHRATLPPQWSQIAVE